MQWSLSRKANMTLHHISKSDTELSSIDFANEIEFESKASRLLCIKQ